MEKSILIVGAGVAGLSAGCYARMNGYRAAILEMHSMPGGLCTSWQRDGYLFDGSVAGLAGTAPGNPLYRLWEELGVIRYCPLHYGENFGHICGPDGRRVTVYADVDRLEAHLLEQFPAESKALLEFTGAIRSVLAVDPPFNSAQGLAALREGVAAGAAMIPRLPALIKYSNVTLREFVQKFHDPFLKLVFSNLVHFGGLDVPLLTVLLPLAYAHRKMAGIPLRGWLSFAQAIEKRFLEMGGTVRYQARAERLIVESGKARGVLLADGTRQTADIVLSAADGRFSHFAFLGRDEHEARRSPFRPERVSDQPAQVNLGVADDFAGVDGPVTYLLPKPFKAAGREHNRITVHTKYYDPQAAPEGKSAVTVFLDSSYSWWNVVSVDPDRYQAEKRKAAEAVIAAIDRCRPGFREKVEVVDVSTPLTRERYTGNWLGAMQAFRPSSNMLGALVSGSPRYAFKGVKDYYMTGQWVEAWGGITTAAQSGRKAVAAICKDDRKPFKTSTP